MSTTRDQDKARPAVTLYVFCHGCDARATFESDRRDCTAATHVFAQANDAGWVLRGGEWKCGKCGGAA